jgi:hypothetical protein
MAGLLSNEINNTEKISVFVGECRRMGISILPPDINKSGLKFTPETVAAGTDRRAQGDGAQRAALQQNAIRYGLAAIKHVGEAAMETAIREREQRGDFTSLEDLCTRLDSRVANRKMLESLIKAGAFDFLGRDRSELFSCIDDAVMASASAQRDRLAGLGKLSAGLAHELNNPASAAKRATSLLRDALKRIKDAVQELGKHQLTAAQKSEIEKLEASFMQPSQNPLDTLATSDLEDQIDSLLRSHGQSDLWQLASDLAHRGVKPEVLESLFATLDAGAAKMSNATRSPRICSIHPVIAYLGVNSRATSGFAQARNPTPVNTAAAKNAGLARRKSRTVSVRLARTVEEIIGRNI